MTLLGPNDFPNNLKPLLRYQWQEYLSENEPRIREILTEKKKLSSTEIDKYFRSQGISPRKVS